MKINEDVTLSRPFAIGVYEVTFDEFDAFCNPTGHVKLDDSGWDPERRPVVNVTWDDAVAYTRWLSVLTGQRHRFPTAAEREANKKLTDFLQQE
ncbi:MULTISPECIES: formylglycine-generating enzyme family protein [unclassified Thiocapsa]|uniref:formylglycine-generating enzyme family protein n=1 Tax=unclassified Thiocapsa TaxID=2641286 RepID=UPI0035B4DB3F